jgi:hypothetical protein
MQRVIMKSKIHRATVTRTGIDFEGSCGIAPELVRASDGVFGVPDKLDSASTHVHGDALSSVRERAAIA